MTVERIDNELCNGCGICVRSCPMDVIRMDNVSEKAVIQYPDDCMLCNWCIRDCPQNAIYVTPEKKSLFFTSWG